MSLVVAAGVRLEINATPGTTLEMVSPYRLSQTEETADQFSALLGDLLAGEQREVVLRLRFASRDERAANYVRVRTVWRQSGNDEVATEWQEMLFGYADDAAVSAEAPDLSAQRVAGLHRAERARRRAIELSRAGDVDAARALLHVVGARIAEYAGSDPLLIDALAGLRAAEKELERRGYQPLVAKEAYYASQSRSRGQRDLRQS